MANHPNRNTTNLKTAKVHDIINELHSRGMAVCVFTPEDVISGHCVDKPPTAKRMQAAADWLLDNRKYVEEAMCEGGWNPINFAPDPIS